jgi:hypothetical protein
MLRRLRIRRTYRGSVTLPRHVHLRVFITCFVQRSPVREDNAFHLRGWIAWEATTRVVVHDWDGKRELGESIAGLEGGWNG